jgi:hypothetical protein
MNIKIDDNYKLSNNEKFYIINLILTTFEKLRTKEILIKISNSTNNNGKKSIEELISNSIEYASKNSKFNKDQILSAITPSIEYFFNNVSLEIRKRSFDINIFN